MNPLDIPIKRLQDGPYAVDLDLGIEALDLTDPEFVFHGPVRGQVVFTLSGRDVMAAGALEVDIVATCVRCLAPFRMRLHAAVNEVWMPSEAIAPLTPGMEEHDEAIVNPYHGEIVEPAEVYRELLMLALPDYPCCSASCKGLCPQCGANLNRGPCACSPADSAALPDWKRALRNLKL